MVPTSPLSEASFWSPQALHLQLPLVPTSPLSEASFWSPQALGLQLHSAPTSFLFKSFSRLLQALCLKVPVCLQLLLVPTSPLSETSLWSLQALGLQLHLPKSSCLSTASFGYYKPIASKPQSGSHKPSVFSFLWSLQVPCLQFQFHLTFDLISFDPLVLASSIRLLAPTQPFL